jgi:hypothetical protein
VPETSEWDALLVMPFPPVDGQRFLTTHYRKRMLD